MLARIQEVKGLLSVNQETQDAILHLGQIHTSELRIVSERLAVQGGNNRETLSIVKSTFSAVREVKDLIDRACQVAVSLQVLASNSIFFRGLDPTRNLPLAAEDALGNILEIPLDLIHSWEVTGLPALVFALAYMLTAADVPSPSRSPI
jgi:hypothetical protein